MRKSLPIRQVQMRQLAHLIPAVLVRLRTWVSPRWGEDIDGQSPTQGSAAGLWNMTPLGSGGHGLGTTAMADVRLFPAAGRFPLRASFPSAMSGRDAFFF